MRPTNFAVRPIDTHEVDFVSELLSTAYYNDTFFKWCVDSDENRHRIVSEYYKIYLRSKGCVAHVAHTPEGTIVGAAVWLPHDADGGMYEEIERVVGPANAPMFRAVAHRSHLNEPPMQPFYQLVGFGVLGEHQGMGVGRMLLKHHLDILDGAGIPTYLEASTPYHGKGVYGGFGYQPAGELMVFAEGAVLYPLWRQARKGVILGGTRWRILDEHRDRYLLLAENVMESTTYHDTFEPISWAGSSIRRYLNSEFLSNFSSEELDRIIETPQHESFTEHGLTNTNTVDRVFLLSPDEVLKYLGGGAGPCSSDFYVDDYHNNARRATYEDGSPSRWFLRGTGKARDFVATVTLDGRICLSGDFVNRKSTTLFNTGARPALWVLRTGSKERLW